MASLSTTRSEWASAPRLAFCTGPRSWAQLQPGEKKQTQRSEDEERIEISRPSVGRTSQLGRRVEKPADARPAGPSGQHDATRHQDAHTNK